MTTEAFCRPIRDSWDQTYEKLYQFFPCLADPARRSSLGSKTALVTLHLVFVGVLFLFDVDLIHKTKKEPWYVCQLRF
ncbi:hypothetical protein GIB67_007039 [Kingdonia uniflora]|uniref:Uncharacterized protein n=1 Tax=Kingdonia uniflora TaxID=39325 RepID=A0A7J7NZA9_9MAGN|nr:hypothetical protein GIB67_007039 [Kingdonia uniflora]